MQKFLLIVCVCLLGASTCWISVISDTDDDLFLKNVACPKFGRNVKYVFQGLGFQPDEETY